MWNFILGFLSARAVRRSRSVRTLFLIVLFGATIAGLIYAYVIFKAVYERSETPNVHVHSSH